LEALILEAGVVKPGRMKNMRMWLYLHSSKENRMIGDGGYLEFSQSPDGTYSVYVDNGSTSFKQL